jgi:RNA polymerase sigma-70 factor, ECF subfamily
MTAEQEYRPAADPFQQLIAQGELLTAIADLDLELRTVIVLRFWSDLTVDQIAERVGWRAGTVKSRLHRALGQLRDRLGTEPLRTESLR